MTTLSDYITFTQTTAVYPGVDKDYVYPTLGLVGETGELAEKVKKHIRGGGGPLPESLVQELTKECGDVLWYVARLYRLVGLCSSACWDAEAGTWEGHTQIGLAIISLASCVGDVADAVENEDAPSSFMLDSIIGHICVIASCLGTTLQSVVQANIDKLNSRKDRGVLHGQGDNR